MLETDIRKIDFGAMNVLKLNCVSLGQDLDAIIVLKSNDTKLLDLIYHKAVDSLVDRIHQKNVYRDFSSALENINAFLAGWMHDGKRVPGLHGYIGLYHKKNLYFSTLGSASCYLYNHNHDLIEITDREDSPKDFSYISSGEVLPGESIIVGTMRLLDILSKDDMKDGFRSGMLRRASENIEKILLHEHSGDDIGLLVFQRPGEQGSKKSAFVEKIKNFASKTGELGIFQKISMQLTKLKNMILQSGGKGKQLLLAFGILLGIVLLYILVSGFLGISNQTGRSEEAKIDLVTAQQHIITASENMNNLDIFSFNIESANEIIQELESEKIFLNDLAKLRDEVGVLQKQFNGISSFETSPQTSIADFNEEKFIVSLIERNGDLYAIHKNSLSGPIALDQEFSEYTFDELFEGDYFTDATVSGDDILLTTNEGKIVGFSNTQTYRYIDVQNQETWEKSSIIDSYASNIYLVSDAGNQIIRHKRLGESFDAGLEYLTDDDEANIGNILSLAIDGGIYILKDDGTVVKLFYSPQYRLENMSLNNLPKNYNFQTLSSDERVKLKTDVDLQYVYMLLQNRVLVFEPNSLRFQDVKSLKYLGQIEGKDIVIEDFYVENDGQIFIASNTGVHRAEFDIVEDKLILK